MLTDKGEFLQEPTQAESTIILVEELSGRLAALEDKYNELEKYIKLLNERRKQNVNRNKM